MDSISLVVELLRRYYFIIVPFALIPGICFVIICKPKHRMIKGILFTLMSTLLIPAAIFSIIVVLSFCGSIIRENWVVAELLRRYLSLIVLFDFALILGIFIVIISKPKHRMIKGILLTLMSTLLFLAILFSIEYKLATW